MILNDQQIKALCDWCAPQPMIAPFLPEQVRRTEQGAPAISSGLSSFGYDIRLATGGIHRFVNPKFDRPAIWSRNTDEWVREPHILPTIDPKAFDQKMTMLHCSVQRDESGSFYFLPPQAYALGVSVETFHIPNNILGICYCKSTYARCGLMVNTTPLEPGWRGQLVIELANLTDLPMKVYANEGIAQVVFSEGDLPSVTYADRAGKYQDQRGIVPARI